MVNKSATSSEEPTESRITRGVARSADQEEISPPDTTILSRYIEGLLDDIANQLTSVYRRADFLRDRLNLLRRLNYEGSTFATSILPVIFDGTIRILEGGAASFPGFKTISREGITYPVLLGGLVKCILKHRDTEKGTKALECLYQLSYAFKKVIGPYSENVVLKQLEDFIAVDASLKEYDYLSEPLRAITGRAREIITTVLRGLDPTDPDQAQDFLPQPGPGATNSPLKKSERYEAHSDYVQISDVVDMDEWYRPPFCPPRLFYLNLGGQPQQHVIRPRKRAALARLNIYDAPTSRFKLVPKTNRKGRGICIEENEVQWLQQALRKALVKRIESHPLTKGYVNFTSQNINREKALDGSIDGSKATLDMSSASDRIWRCLVAFLFGKNKKLLDFILACSTNTVELPDVIEETFINELPINKISPMGSAICFPIMALVHFSLIKAILEFSVVPRELIKDVYVYGDDIIVNRECVQAIYDYLPLYGMKFNEDKSFHKSLFRESCGLHAYKGRDITPVRFKIARKNLRLSDVPGVLRLEEAFYKKNYRKTAERLRIEVQRCCIGHGIKDFYPVSTTSQLLGFYRPDNEASLTTFKSIVEGKWHRDVQDKPYYACKVYTVPVIADYKVESPPLVGEPGYLRWLCTHGERSKFVEDCPSEKKYIRWKTLPESALGFRSSEEQLRPQVKQFTEEWSHFRGYDY